MLNGTRQMRDYLTDQLRRSQPSGQVFARIDSGLAADGLLTVTDGLASHLLQGLHTPDTARAVLAEHLNHLFDRP